VLGLDWGDGPSLKYVLLRRTAVGSKLLIELFGRIAVSSDSPEASLDTAQALHELFLRERQLKKSKVVIGIGTDKVVLKKESFPHLTPKEISQTVLFGMQKDLSKEGEDSEVICDHFRLRPDPSIDGNTEFFCFGAETRPVSEKAGIIASEGTIPVKIIPNVLALKNLIDLIPGEKLRNNACFLDIGAVRSVLVFFKNGEVDFSREIVIGGEDFTKAITGTIFHEGRAIQFTQQEAREFKLKHGYPLGFSEGMTYKGAPLSEVGAMMRPVVERLTGEIHRSIGFYKEKSGGQAIEALFLLGGGAELKHLSQVLTERLDMPTYPLSLPQNFKIAGGLKQEQVFKGRMLEYATALALALETNPDRNLLPHQYQNLHKMASIQRILGWAAFFIIILAAGITALDRLSLRSLKSQIRAEEQRADIVTRKVARYEKAKNTRVELEGNILRLNAKIHQDPRTLHLLKIISNTLPKSLSLVYVKILDSEDPSLKKGQETRPSGENSDKVKAEKRPRILLIEGESKLSIPDIRISVAQFMLELSKSGYLTDVKLQNEKIITETDEFIFDIEGKLTF
jgi:type IV pilus assembly protein PilM